MAFPDRNELRNKLRRMGVSSNRRAARRQPAVAAGAGGVFPGGQSLETAFGPAYLVDTRYSLGHRHGPYQLADLLARSGVAAAGLLRETSTVDLDLERLVFLDTETTGLGGGAGTLAFMVGVGWYQDSEFVVQQYFLRSPEEETAMLSHLAALLNRASGLVTFNGRSFDVPLLETRYLMNRLDGMLDIRGLPNLDLLHPARRLWRGRLESCSLGSLEVHVLERRRTDQDVPGWMIPTLYNHYLRTGETGDMLKVLYHNLEDILSMVSLAVHLLDRFTPPGQPPAAGLSGVDCLRLAQWYVGNDRLDDAEVAYQAALARDLPDDQRALALKQYAGYLKRADRRADAGPYWEALAAHAPADPEAAVELAKYFEWHVRDLQTALYWTNKAITGVQQQSTGWRRDQALADLDHRRARLARKLERIGDG